MIDLSDTVYIGRITKKHGVRGQVILESDLLADNEDIELEQVFILIEGKPVPFFLEELRPKAANTFIITLTFMDSEEEAQGIIGWNVHANVKAVTSSQTNEYLQWLTYEIFTGKDQKLGVIKNIQSPDTNPLFEVETDTGDTRLIPAHPDMIKSVNRRQKRIIVTLPQGFDEL